MSKCTNKIQRDEDKEKASIIRASAFKVACENVEMGPLSSCCPYGAKLMVLSGGYQDDEEHGEWFLSFTHVVMQGGISMHY